MQIAASSSRGLIPVRRAGVYVPVAAVLAMVAAVALGVLWVDDGHFTFPLDDPYIHLALAKNVWRGHYGLNAGEVSAPASSIVWPFLLAPFAATSLALAAPLAFDALCACATVALFASLLDRLIDLDDPERKVRVVVGASVFFALATNLVGLALLGMEHSLQVLCATWLATLVVREARSDRGEARPSPWAVAGAIAVGPVVRYELLGLSVLAAAYFFLRGRRVAAVGGLLTSAACLATFSLELVAHGLSPLPTSVLAKAGAAQRQSLLATALGNVRMQTHAGWAVILLLVACAALVAIGRRRIARSDRGPAALMLLTLVGHLLVGRSGWFGRYEAYVLASTYVFFAGVFASRLSAWAAKPPSLASMLAAGAFAAVLASRYVGITVMTPLGARNIYEQQAQTARFVSEFYRRPVGVNDVGYVAWQSDAYVLDYIGLASSEALAQQRLHGDDAGAWVGPISRAHDVRFAAIYDAWFRNLPASWVPCGRLRLGSRKVTASMDTVTFYVLDDSVRDEIKADVAAWRQALPTSVRFDVAEACR